MQVHPFVNSNQQKANLLAMGGNADEVEMFCKNTGLYPNSRGANLAARCGHTGMLNFLLYRGIKPTNQGARWAAEKGYLKVVKLLGRAGVCLHGSPDAALVRGHFGLVLFLYRKYGISPTPNGVDVAVAMRNIDAVGFARSKFRIQPTEHKHLYSK